MRKQVSMTVTGTLLVSQEYLRPTGTPSTDRLLSHDDGVEVLRFPSGAFHYKEVLQRIEWGDLDVSIHGPVADVLQMEQFARHHTVWTPQRRANGEADTHRVSQYLGFEVPLAFSATGWNSTNAVKNVLDLLAPQVEKETQILVCHGMSEGFGLALGSAPRKNQIQAGWIVWRASMPRHVSWPNTLANALEASTGRSYTDPSERCIAIIDLDDLRGESLMPPGDLWWEDLAEGVHHAVKKSVGLSKCHTVIVQVPCAGALVLRRGARDVEVVIDPRETEGSWQRRFVGRVFGYGVAMTYSILRALAPLAANHRLLADVDDDTLSNALHEGIDDGVRCGRWMLETGFSTAKQVRADRAENALKTAPAYDPTAKAVAEILNRSDRAKEPGSVVAFFRAVSANAGGFTIPRPSLDEFLDAMSKGQSQAARLIPALKIGDMESFNAEEIRSFRSVARLIESYVGGDDTQPLSIAVFGPPGSGKSFGIKELSKALGKRVADRVLEFNISQFRQPDELAGAFHQVRDEALSGRPPIVFFDEFDTTLAGQHLGWLRYFLAPMQDGKFLEGQVLHPLGRCILIFAGGTSETFATFANQKAAIARPAKLPDFLSRIRGHVDITGVNPQPKRELDSGTSIRRLVMLASMVRRNAPHLVVGDTLRVSRGVLRAFATASGFVHGTRSMEQIVKMSALRNTDWFGTSQLPGETQLAMHVRDVPSFIRTASEGRDG